MHFTGSTGDTLGSRLPSPKVAMDREAERSFLTPPSVLIRKHLSTASGVDLNPKTYALSRLNPRNSAGIDVPAGTPARNPADTPAQAPGPRFPVASRLRRGRPTQRLLRCRLTVLPRTRCTACRLAVPGPNVRPGSRRSVFGQIGQGASFFPLSSIEQFSAAQDTVSGAIPDARPYPSLQTAKLKRTLLAGLLGITRRFGQTPEMSKIDPEPSVGTSGRSRPPSSCR